MTDVSADPQRTAEAGRRAEAVSESLDVLAERARGLARIPMRQHFPSVDEGQRLAGIWDQGREHFADGLRFASATLSALGLGLQQAGSGFAVAEATAEATVTARPAPTIDLPL